MSVLTKLGSQPSTDADGTVDRPIDSKWDVWVNQPLLQWGLTPNPTPDEDDGFLMPVRAAVDTACAVALRFRDQRLAAPDDVVATGDGGVFFHWGDPGQTFETFEFFPDGTGVYTRSERLTRVETSRRFDVHELRHTIRG